MKYSLMAVVAVIILGFAQVPTMAEGNLLDLQYQDASLAQGGAVERAPLPPRALDARAGQRVTPEDGLAGYIIGIGYFINYSIIPLVIGLALLVFLYHMVRFFLNSANLEKREEAKRGALYGIAAFVAIVSIWGVVNLLVGGFNFDREEALCPDYLGSWCGSEGFNSFDRGGFATGSGSGSGSGTGIPNRDGQPLGSGGSGSGSGGSGSGSGGSNSDPNFSPLAELLFGEYEDEADFVFRNGSPRAQTNTVSIANNASCIDGIATLQLAAAVESNQAGFALYEDATGAVTWTNITDQHSDVGIGYDADTINQIIANGAENLHIVQMHPEAQTADAGLSMDGHGPSNTDHFVMCDGTANDATYVTVDQGNVWTSTQPTDACPRRVNEEDALVILDALTAVAMVDPSDREFEWDRMLQSSVTPDRHDFELGEFASTNFNSLSTAEILAFGQPFADEAQVEQILSSVNVVCSAF